MSSTERHPTEAALTAVIHKWAIAHGLAVDRRNKAVVTRHGALLGLIQASILPGYDQSLLDVSIRITDVPWLLVSERCLFGREWNPAGVALPPRVLTANDFALDRDHRFFSEYPLEIAAATTNSSDIEMLLNAASGALRDCMVIDRLIAEMAERWHFDDGVIADHWIVLHAAFAPSGLETVVSAVRERFGDYSLLFRTVTELMDCIARNRGGISRAVSGYLP